MKRQNLWLLEGYILRHTNFALNVAMELNVQDGGVLMAVLSQSYCSVKMHIVFLFVFTYFSTSLTYPTLYLSLVNCCLPLYRIIHHPHSDRLNSSS